MTKEMIMKILANPHEYTVKEQLKAARLAINFLDALAVKDKLLNKKKTPGFKVNHD